MSALLGFVWACACLLEEAANLLLAAFVFWGCADLDVRLASATLSFRTRTVQLPVVLLGKCHFLLCSTRAVLQQRWCSRSFQRSFTFATTLPESCRAPIQHCRCRTMRNKFLAWPPYRRRSPSRHHRSKDFDTYSVFFLRYPQGDFLYSHCTSISSRQSAARFTSSIDRGKDKCLWSTL